MNFNLCQPKPVKVTKLYQPDNLTKDHIIDNKTELELTVHDIFVHCVNTLKSTLPVILIRHTCASAKTVSPSAAKISSITPVTGLGTGTDVYTNLNTWKYYLIPNRETDIQVCNFLYTQANYASMYMYIDIFITSITLHFFSIYTFIFSPMNCCSHTRT